jgi:eukaryotic-like serine/threonine-protein kinase
MVFGRRYRVTEKIGTGGMADVYKAVDETLGRTVAVKVMHPRYASDPSFAQRFRHEAQAAANLVSPNIVNMYDWGADGDTYYIVMEYVRGNDLKDIILQKGALPSAKVADIGAQVCGALSVAHGYDIIHRDIKPHNIMVQPDGSVKVMDFGIARATNSTMTQTGSVLGTAHYVSPEQAQGKELQATSDLYSLGIVLFEAATGEVPFDADTPVAVALKQVNEQPPMPRSINPSMDPGLEAIIVKAMQKNPSLRYGSADEMRKDLLAVVRGQEPAAIAGLAAASSAHRADETAVLPAVSNGNSASYSQSRKPAKGRPVWPWVLVAIAIVLAGFGIAYAAGIIGNRGVNVPDLTGMSVAEATAALQSKELVLGPHTEQYSDAMGAGKITTQTPGPGVNVDKGTSVTFVISKGVMPVNVPKVIGLTDGDAIKALQAKGFIPVAGPSRYDKTPLGKVIEQSPAAGTPAPKGSQVTYVVSKGPEMAVVPDVVGMTKADALSSLSQAGFKVDTTSAYSSTVDSGKVISQNPSGGGAYAAKSTVTIRVSKGEQPIVVPKLVGLTREAAMAKISALGLTPNVTAGGSGPTYSGKVTAQSPPSGTEIFPSDPPSKKIVDITVDEATEPPAP